MASFWKKFTRGLSGAAVGAGTGFLMGGPVGALAGGVGGGLMGGLGNQAITPRSMLGQGALGFGLGGATAAFGGLGGIPGTAGPWGQALSNRMFTMGAGGLNPFAGTPGGATGVMGSPFSQLMGGMAGGGAKGGLMSNVLPWAFLGAGMMGQRSQQQQAQEMQNQMLGQIGQVRGSQMTSKSPEFQNLQQQLRQTMRGRSGERGVQESPSSVFLEAQALSNLQAQLAQQQFLNERSLLDPTLAAYQIGQQQQPNPLLQMGGEFLMRRFTPQNYFNWGNM